MNIYIPGPDRIVHNTYVDMSSRLIGRPVHVVQYDDSIPILAVSMYNDGQLYKIPLEAQVNIRLSKGDGHFVYNPALGCDSTKHIVYFAISQQMTSFSGIIAPVVEVEINNSIAASSSFSVLVDRNPVQQVAIVSSTEYKTAKQYAKEAIDSAASAASSCEKAITSENNAKSYAEFGIQLINDGSVMQSILDSTGAMLLDSSGNALKGRRIFANGSEIISLRQTVASLEILIDGMADKLQRLANHALLDNTLGGQL